MGPSVDREFILAIVITFSKIRRERSIWLPTIFADMGANSLRATLGGLSSSEYFSVRKLDSELSNEGCRAGVDILFGTLANLFSGKLNFSAWNIAKNYFSV